MSLNTLVPRRDPRREFAAGRTVRHVFEASLIARSTGVDERDNRSKEERQWSLLNGSMIRSFSFAGNWRFCFLYENGLISGCKRWKNGISFFFFFSGNLTNFSGYWTDSFFATRCLIFRMYNYRISFQILEDKSGRIRSSFKLKLVLVITRDFIP